MKKDIFFVLLLIIYPSLLLSQEIRGKVFYENKPLEGVNIINATTLSGTSSNSRGKFKLPITLGDSIFLSFVGMKTIKRKIINNEGLIINMESDYNVLEGATVVGSKKPSKYSREKIETFENSFGEVNIKKAGYAISQVRGEDIVNSVGRDRGLIPAIVFALEGKVPSYQVGAGGVVLRDSGSINSTSYALWEIDGQTFDGFPPHVDLNTVEYVNVVKGLGGTTLYGTRGRGGVIVVKTTQRKRLNSKVLNTGNDELGEKGISYAQTRRRHKFDNLENEKQIIDTAKQLSQDYISLRGLAYYAQSIGELQTAAKIYRMILSNSEDKINSLRDIAHTWAISGRTQKAWTSYMTALKENNGEFQEANIDKIIFNEMERLYVTENLKDKVNDKFEIQSDFSNSQKNTTRIVIEWGNPGHNLSIEVLNPNLQSYTLNFGSAFQKNDRIQEFFLDDTLKGEWAFNLTQEFDNQNDLKLKVTIYRNWFSYSKIVVQTKYFELEKDDNITYNLFNLNML
jgi:hypothetical protein